MISYEDCLNYKYIENGTMENVLPSDAINLGIRETIKNRVDEVLSLIVVGVS